MNSTSLRGWYGDLSDGLKDPIFWREVDSNIPPGKLEKGVRRKIGGLGGSRTKHGRFPISCGTPLHLSVVKKTLFTCRFSSVVCFFPWGWGWERQIYFGILSCSRRLWPTRWRTCNCAEPEPHSRAGEGGFGQPVALARYTSIRRLLRQPHLFL